MEWRIKADSVLRYMSENRADNFKPEQLCKLAGLSIDKNESHLLLDMLRSDGYIELTDSKLYFILYKGLLFISDGGYCLQKSRADAQANLALSRLDIMEKNTYRLTLGTWALVVATLLLCYLEFCHH